MQLDTIHRAICSLLFEKGGEGDLFSLVGDLCTAIGEAGDVPWEMGDGGAACLGDLVAGLWWAIVATHEGQTSEGYRALCQLGEVYTAGRCSTGPEPDSGEEYVYAAALAILCPA